MQAVSCLECHWASDMPDGKIFCYDGNDIHLPQDCCRNFLEKCRIDAKTGKVMEKVKDA